MFTISIQRGQSYLLASASGTASLADFCGMTALVTEIAHRQKCRRALIDVLAVVPELTMEEHIELAEFIAKTVVGLQLAVVVPSQDRVFIGEETAQNAGSHLRTFTDLVEAERWMLDGEQPWSSTIAE